MVCKMIPIGKIFRYNTEIDEPEELTPNLYTTVMRSLGEKYLTKFGNAKYVFENTFFTDPLKLLIKKVVEGLNKVGTTPFPLIKGFGFGKTHSLILLWHIFNGGDISELPGDLDLSQELIDETLVLGCDVSNKEPPLRSLVKLIKAYKDQRVESTSKDTLLIRTLSDVFDSYDEHDLMTNPSELLEFLEKIVDKCKRNHKKPKFLFLIDELGYGVLRRIDMAKDTGNEELLDDVRKLITFIYTAAEELQRRGASIVIIYALAEQDFRALAGRSQYYAKDEKFSLKIEGLKTLIEVDLRERLRRYSGGLESSPLQINPQQNVEIAKFRVLKPLSDSEEAMNKTIEYIETFLRQFRIFENETEIHDYKKKIETYYPLAPDLIDLLFKVHNSVDIPKTEFLRTVISILRIASKTALETEPDIHLFGIKHLSLENSALNDSLDDTAQIEWLNIISDLSTAIENSENPKLAGHIAKIIVSKGVTSNFLSLIELGERSIRYGTTGSAIQASIVSTTLSEDVDSYLEGFPNVLIELKLKSARIIERTINGVDYSFPSIIKHILNIRESYIVEEKRKIRDKGIVNYIRNSRLFHIFKNLREIQSKIVIKDYNSVICPEISGQLEKPFIILIPPWDVQLFNKIESSGYEPIVKIIQGQINESLEHNKISHYPYVIIAIPNLSKLNQIEESLINYHATLRFLEYLDKEENLAQKYTKKISQEITRKRPREVDEAQLASQLSMSIKKQISEAKKAANQEQLANGRKIIAGILSLYEKPIYYKLSEKNYVVSETFIEQYGEKIKELVKIRATKLVEYSNIVGRFLNTILDVVGYESNSKIIFEVIKEKFKEILKDSKVISIDLKELTENLILGFYKVIPLNSNVAEKAIIMLDGKTIEYPQKLVKITIDRKNQIICFTHQEKKPKIKLKVIYTPRKSSYLPGELITLTIQATNKGAAGECFIKIKDGSDDGIIEEFHEPKLEMNEDITKSAELDLPTVDGLFICLIEGSHKLGSIDDFVELKFPVKIPIAPIRYARRLVIQIEHESILKVILNFIDEKGDSIDRGNLSLEFEDITISTRLKKVDKEKMDILIRFLLTLTRKFGGIPELTLYFKEHLIEFDDVQKYFPEATVT